MLFEIKRNTHEQPFTYANLDQRQREIALQVNQGEPGRILISEVAPVVTFGKRPSEENLGDLGIDLYHSDRGGFATYHGPGQWILFPVEKVERLTGDSRGVRKAVGLLLETAKGVAQEFGLDAHVESGKRLGVWIGPRKLAAVGISIHDGIVHHGMAINVYRDPRSFRGVRPCGLDAETAYLVESPLGCREQSELMARSQNVLCQSFESRFS